MGAWNYGTSDYVTVGIQPYDYEETKDYPEDYNIYEDDYNNAKTIMDKYSVENLEYFDVTLEDGYYEGFYLNIEFNRCYFDRASEERTEAQKEITKIKKMLIDLIDVGLCVLHPGWCTAYLNYEDSIKEIGGAIKTMRNDVKNTLTVNQYFKERKVA